MAGNNFLVGIGNVLNASSITIETNNQAETNEEEGDKNSQKANATKVFAPSKRAYFQILLKRAFSLRPNDKLTLYWDVSKEVFVIYHLVVVVGWGGGVRLNHRTQKRLRCFLGGEVIRLSRKLVGRGVVNVFSSHVDLNATSAKYNFIRNFIEVPSNNFFISSRMTRSQIFFKLSFSTFLPSDKSSRAKSLEPYR